jgi:hypothetical protein
VGGTADQVTGGAVAELLVELCNQQGAQVRSCVYTNRSSEETHPRVAPVG